MACVVAVLIVPRLRNVSTVQLACFLPPLSFRSLLQQATVRVEGMKRASRDTSKKSSRVVQSAR